MLNKPKSLTPHKAYEIGRTMFLFAVLILLLLLMKVINDVQFGLTGERVVGYSLFAYLVVMFGLLMYAMFGHRDEADVGYKSK